MFFKTHVWFLGILCVLGGIFFDLSFRITGIVFCVIGFAGLSFSYLEGKFWDKDKGFGN